MKQSNLPEHKAQEARILSLLKDENPCQWVPCYRVQSPDGPDGKIILQYCRAISNLRYGKFDGSRHNIQNRTERMNGETHGFYRWMPGEYCKGASLDSQPANPKPLKSWEQVCAERDEKMRQPEPEFELTP